MPRTAVDHGTYRAYLRCRRRHEGACAACLAAKRDRSSRISERHRAFDRAEVVTLVPEWMAEEGWTKPQARERLQVRLAEETAVLTAAIAEGRWADVVDTVAGIDCLLDMWCEAVDHDRYGGPYFERSAS